MSEREKTLLAAVAFIAVFLGSFFAYTQVYQPKIAADKRREATAKSKLRNASLVLAQQDDLQASMTWLERAEGEPTTYQVASSKLQSAMQNAAQRRGLETRDQQILPQVEGANYSRVRVKQKVSGPEQKIQQWLLDVHRPNDLQVITRFDLAPTRTDLTRADCEVEVEKWFVPSESL